MKKAVLILLLGAALAALTACGRPFVCSLCGEEKTGKHHSNEAYGITMTLCDDCYQGINELFGY